ncbi:TVAZ2 protein, partial [Polypterus senegalus]
MMVALELVQAAQELTGIVAALEVTQDAHALDGTMAAQEPAVAKNDLKNPVNCLITGDLVTNIETEASGTEGGKVTLQCSYSTANSYAYLYWYRKYPNQAMEYILYKGARSGRGTNNIAAFAQKRFSSIAEEEFTTLTISTLALSDSAIYYCALRPTSLKSSRTLNKKLSRHRSQR